ncbi:sulfur carrier protein ThiS [Candidatus Fukatsuia symbiotica]|uniref:Sulfur carrier protein ThiS n=1 Tax=Candidatus Fukatsuia symbiotica TaxID=1878942 RepID=A0A2U8I9Q9_9GAMM|nr:sulfur carrier protein ThiS [Candidatus Fukatsuia symbiotica]AWK14774.1 sulfur carrier protein ThiS [Candidatus Fukatsuia symbiotica]MEA9445106.1 sulfur carrier protein ThiS [Candidatus Fukatsuia symbiotica]
MKITLNDQPIELEAAMTIDALLRQLRRHQQGHALAINQNIIPRSHWETHLLQESDEILLFQAIAGG